MPDAFGVCGKKEENLFWGYSQLPAQIARTKVRLLYIFLEPSVSPHNYLFRHDACLPSRHIAYFDFNFSLKKMSNDCVSHLAYCFI